jgi:hypothetical protein
MNSSTDHRQRLTCLTASPNPGRESNKHETETLKHKLNHPQHGDMHEGIFRVPTLPPIQTWLEKETQNEATRKEEAQGEMHPRPPPMQNEGVTTTSQVKKTKTDNAPDMMTERKKGME